MRLFASLCFAVALFYGWTAVDAMRSGVTTPMRGDTSAEHRRDDAASSYSKYLAARWLFAGGFIALGVVMNVFASRFEKMEREDAK